MLCVVVAFVVDAASCNNFHIGIFADLECVIDGFFQALGKNYRNMDVFVFCIRLDDDINARFVCLRDDIDIFRNMAFDALAVFANVIGALRERVDIGNFS